MACIIKKNNSPYYYIKYYINGEPKEYSTKSRSYEVAKRIRNEIENRLALGKFDLIPTNYNLLVKEWYDEFFEDKSAEITPGSVDRYKRSIDMFLNFYSDVKSIRQFTGRHILDYRNKRIKEGMKESTVCNELTNVGIFFNRCEEQHKIPSPMKGITIGEPDKKPPCIYTQDEIRRFTIVEYKRDKAMFILDLQAGLRKGEMGSRKWKHIDFERDLIWVRKEDGFIPKDDADRSIPLKPETKEALLEWQKVSKYNAEKDFIFPNAKGKEFIVMIKDKKTGKAHQVSKFDVPMSKILKKIGIKGHCQKFRDTFASYSLGVGIPPQNVQQWLGHSDFKTTQHYLNYLPKAIEPDIRKLFEWR